MPSILAPQTISLVVKTPPAVQAVEQATLKQALGRGVTTADTQLAWAIETATQMVQQITKTILIDTSFVETRDLLMEGRGVSINDFYTTIFRGISAYSVRRFLTLLADPAKSITTFKIYDENGTPTTVASTDYFLDTAGNRFYLNASFSNGLSIRRIAGYEIEYVAGTSSTTAGVSTAIKSAIIAYTGKVLDIHEGTQTSVRYTDEWEKGVLRMLAPFKRFTQ